MPVIATGTAALAGLGGAVALMVAVWVASLVRSDASLVDRFWGPGFVGLAWWYYVSGPAVTGEAGWPLLTVVLVTVWGVRLGAHITWRNWGHGEDFRYRAMRERGGPAFRWMSLVTVFGLQALLLWVISLALLPAARGGGQGPGWLAWPGLVLWLVGFYFEAVGDWQLARFRADPANRGKVLDTGVWRYSRHPNYFGDACLWWGFYCFAAAQGAWWSVFSPMLMTGLLLKVSGVAMLERTLVDTKPRYRDYVARTSAFFPLPPRRSPPGSS